MSFLKKEDSAKWINAFVAVVSILIWYVLISFFLQLSEWFDLEAKISYFEFVHQGVAIAMAFSSFIYVVNSRKCTEYLNDVYAELTKVTWSDKDSTVRLTIGIVIGLIIAGIVFGLVDLGVGKLLELLYD